MLAGPNAAGDKIACPTMPVRSMIVAARKGKARENAGVEAIIPLREVPRAIKIEDYGPQVSEPTRSAASCVRKSFWRRIVAASRRRNSDELEDQQILRVLGKQKDLGFQIFTDGEFRRRGFMSDFHESVSGLDMGGSIDRKWQNAGPGAPTTPTSRPVAGVVVDKIRQTKRLTSHEVDFLKRHAPGDIKITLPEREPVSGDLLSQGDQRQGLSHALRAAVGHRADHQVRDLRRCSRTA